MKICVFPNDPIIAYYEKGEIKNRYFNPKNLFEEVHVISPTKKEIEEEKVQELAGSALLKIYPIGHLTILNYKSKLKNIRKLIKKINPDVIRSYNPLIQGFIAVKISKEFDIPCIVSIHNNYDKDVRGLAKKSKQYSKCVKLWYTSKFVEPYVLKNATTIICAYRTIVPYAKKYGTKSLEVIYNRVNLDNFSPTNEAEFQFSVPAVIYVARLAEEKNQQCLIKAVQDLDVKLILVGDGPDYQKLSQLTRELGIEDKVIFIKSVPNDKLARYYNSADIFAAPIKQSGVSIPMLEAMACGLPIIATSRDSTEYEDIDDAVIFSKNDPDNFKKAIMNLIENNELKKKLSQKALKKVQMLNGNVMEKKEYELYKKILNEKY